MEKIETIEEFEQAVEKKERFFLLKHSLTCPISQAAFEQYEKFANEEDGHFYYLAVQEARPLSNYIAEKYNIKHESPQAILFDNEGAKWHASHWKITVDSLKEAAETK